MKWGSSSSSSRTSTTTSKPSLISHVFPTSWFSKFKLETCKPELKGKRNSLYFGEPRIARFYDDDDDDGYLRLSFGEGNAEDEARLPLKVVSENGNAKERSLKKGKEVIEKRKIDLACVASKHHQHASSSLEKIEEEVCEEKKAKSEKQRRKSVYIRPKRGKKFRVWSPRIAEIRKLKALQEMALAKKAAAAKERKVVKQQQVKTSLDSFAVVKCSFDPHKDFRDSMVEMIVEKKITRPDDLEELLACYLTLNSDEYHDLIIKVFRQVWFDLNRTCFGK